MGKFDNLIKNAVEDAKATPRKPSAPNPSTPKPAQEPKKPTPAKEPRDRSTNEPFIEFIKGSIIDNTDGSTKQVHLYEAIDDVIESITSAGKKDSRVKKITRASLVNNILLKYINDNKTEIQEFIKKNRKIDLI